MDWRTASERARDWSGQRISSSAGPARMRRSPPRSAASSRTRATASSSSSGTSPTATSWSGCTRRSKSGARVIALLSNEYLASDHCAAEWLNALAGDPLNKQGRLIVLRVAECTPTGLLTALAYWDLVPVRGDGALLRDIVLAAVQARPPQGRRTPSRAILARAAPDRAPGDQGDAELHRSRGRAGGDPRAAVGGPHRGGDPAGRRARARRHRQVGARARVRASQPGRLRRRLVAQRREARGRHGGLRGRRAGAGRARRHLHPRPRRRPRIGPRPRAGRWSSSPMAASRSRGCWSTTTSTMRACCAEWAPRRQRARPGHEPAERLAEDGEHDRDRGMGAAGRDPLSAAGERAGRPRPRPTPRPIAVALGRLPLALSHAAALLRARQNITAASYLASLDPTDERGAAGCRVSPRGVRDVPGGDRRRPSARRRAPAR